VELNFKYDIVEQASKMSNINLDKKIDEMITMILDEELSEEARQEAREIAAIYANVAEGRKHDVAPRKRGVGCTGGCC